MLRVLADFLMIIICFILQNTVFQALALASISPNLLVILTSSIWMALKIWTSYILILRKKTDGVRT